MIVCEGDADMKTKLEDIMNKILAGEIKTLEG